MKKVGIVTIWDINQNYGNRLQNYAVQTVLQKLGFDTETISLTKRELSRLDKLKFVINKLTGYVLTSYKFSWKYKVNKRLKFEKFNRKCINVCYINNISEVPEKDYYVVGSDQVWNPSWYDDSSDVYKLYALVFTEPAKKVCFSPSFGVSIDSIDEKWKKWFSEILSKYNEISVREDSGAEIVKELTEKNAEVLIDPTMMLTAADWKKIQRKPKHVDFNKKYILTYFLGNISEQVNDEINKYAEDNGLVIHHLLCENNPEVFDADPGEFIYLISNAELVITDSFHACVFSVLFEKPFLVYDRSDSENNMASRITTLLTKFGLERKMAHAKENELFECDYEESFIILEKEQQKVYDYLKRNMDM